MGELDVRYASCSCRDVGDLEGGSLETHLADMDGGRPARGSSQLPGEGHFSHFPVQGLGGERLRVDTPDNNSIGSLTKSCQELLHDIGNLGASDTFDGSLPLHGDSGGGSAHIEHKASVGESSHRTASSSLTYSAPQATGTLNGESLERFPGGGHSQDAHSSSVMSTLPELPAQFAIRKHKLHWTPSRNSELQDSGVSSAPSSNYSTFRGTKAAVSRHLSNMSDDADGGGGEQTSTSRLRKLSVPLSATMRMHDKKREDITIKDLFKDTTPAEFVPPDDASGGDGSQGPVLSGQPTPASSAHPTPRTTTVMEESNSRFLPRRTDIDQQVQQAGRAQSYFSAATVEEPPPSTTRYPAYPSLYTGDGGAIKRHSVFVPGEKLELVDLSIMYIRPHKLVQWTNQPNVISISKIRLTMRHNGLQWSLEKRYEDIERLHHEMYRYRAKSKVKEMAHRGREFPDLPDVSSIKKQHVYIFHEALLQYLRMIFGHKNYRNDKSVAKFLEASCLSFVSELGAKRKEGTLLKTRTVKAGRWNWRVLRLSRRRWFVLKDSCLLYVRRHAVRGVILFDQGFMVESNVLGRKLTIRTACLEMDVEVESEVEQQAWYEAIQDTAFSCLYTKWNPNESFAPVRPGTRCKFLIDGYTYMESVYRAIMSATEEIFITDWWLSPEIFLVRKYCPESVHHLDTRYRLDNALNTKAKHGVRIYVILYNEIKMALGLQSAYSQKVLEKLDPKIRVIRHPHGQLGRQLFWANHEKILVVDQSIAYVGGIDLAFGRWDDRLHRLTDLGGADATPVSHDTTPAVRSRSRYLFLRMSHSTVRDLRAKSRRISVEPIRLKGIRDERDGGPASNRAFKRQLRSGMNKYWGTFKKKVRTLKEMEKLNSTTSQGEARTGLIGAMEDAAAAESGGDDSIDDSDVHLSQGSGQLQDQVLWVGQDYVNIIKKDHEDLHQPFLNLIDRQTTPRMPWHDLSSVVYGECARDVGRHFIERWNYAKKLQLNDNKRYPYLIPKSAEDVQLKREHFVEKDTFSASCQVLRSGCDWSVGIRAPAFECSIYNAYLTAIDSAQHYIYIENQFLISSTSYNGVRLFNQIVDHIEKRILRAFYNPKKPKFRVYFLLPLIPGFPGQIGQTGGEIPRKIQNWMYRTLSQGADSLIERLAAHSVPVMEYVSVCGLRTHGSLRGKPTTEIVFIHDKMMIVDDRVTIIGSANINDRSMTGRFDSEVAVVFRDEEFIQSEMDGEPYQAGKFAWGLRQFLWREHLLDMRGEVYMDPVGDHFFKNKWLQVAARNTKIYEDVFNVVPCNSVRTFKELRERMKSAKLADLDPDQAKVRLAAVQGYLVLFPLGYLCNEDLGNLNVTDKEFILPEKTFC